MVAVWYNRGYVKLDKTGARLKRETAKMTRRQVISFRLFLYLSILLAALFVKWVAGANIFDHGMGSAVMLVTIFIIIGGLIMLAPISCVPGWYLNTFRKTKFSSLAFFPLTAFIPCFYVIKQFIKEDQKIPALDNGDADFDTDKSLGETKTKHYDLSKLDHTIALMVTGVWSLISLAFTLGIFVLLFYYAIGKIT